LLKCGNWTTTLASNFLRKGKSALTNQLQNLKDLNIEISDELVEETIASVLRGSVAGEEEKLKIRV